MVKNKKPPSTAAAHGATTTSGRITTKDLYVLSQISQKLQHNQLRVQKATTAQNASALSG